MTSQSVSPVTASVATTVLANLQRLTLAQLIADRCEVLSRRFHYALMVDDVALLRGAMDGVRELAIEHPTEPVVFRSRHLAEVVFLARRTRFEPQGESLQSIVLGNIERVLANPVKRADCFVFDGFFFWPTGRRDRTEGWLFTDAAGFGEALPEIDARAFGERIRLAHGRQQALPTPMMTDGLSRERLVAAHMLAIAARAFAQREF